MVAKKRGRPATGQGEQIVVRTHRDLLRPLDAYIAAQPDPKPSRPEAIRILLRDCLTGLGYMHQYDSPETVD